MPNNKLTSPDSFSVVRKGQTRQSNGEYWCEYVTKNLGKKDQHGEKIQYLNWIHFCSVFLSLHSPQKTHCLRKKKKQVMLQCYELAKLWIKFTTINEVATWLYNYLTICPSTVILMWGAACFLSVCYVWCILSEFSATEKALLEWLVLWWVGLVSSGRDVEVFTR